LFTRLRCREALEFAKSAHPLDKDEDFHLQLRYARALHLLGEVEQAKERFAALGKDLKSPAQASSARDLIKTLKQLSLHEQAAAVAAKMLALLPAEKSTSPYAEVLEPIFERDAEIAATWWTYLCGELVHSTPERRFQSLEQIMAGQPIKRLDQWASEMAGVSTPNETTAGEHRVEAAAVAMLRAGKEDKAREYFELAIKREPNVAASIRYADHLASRQHFKEAADWYKHAGAIEPGNALALFLQGDSIARAGDAAEGKRLIDLAHWVPLGDDYQRGELIRELQRRGFADDAKREIDLALTFGWYRYWHMGNIISAGARLARREHDYSRAIAGLEKAVAGCMWKAAGYVEMRSYVTVPQDMATLRVRTLLEAGRYEDAFTAIRAGLAVLPGDYGLTTLAVNAFDASGRKKQADELFAATLGQYEKLCGEFPNCVFAHYRYSMLAAGCGRELDQALSHAETAVRLAGNDPNPLDALAEVHFRRGDSKQAIALMRRCVAESPQNLFHQKQLARYQSGDRRAPMPEQDD
jgi:tetratricopeptide (TPR) repeat protein